MAPEVLRHEAYGQGADVFSFGMWEVEEGRVPDLVEQERPWRRGGSWLIALEELYAVRARLRFGKEVDTRYVNVVEACMAQDAVVRPSFANLVDRLIASWLNSHYFLALDFELCLSLDFPLLRSR